MRYSMITITTLCLIYFMMGCSDWTPNDVKAPELEYRLTQPDGTIFIDVTLGMGTGKYFLQETTEVKDYHIVISSFGGSAFDCMSIIERIRVLQSKGAHITTEVYSQAMSAGAVIFMAGDTRIVGPNSLIMIHCSRVLGGYPPQPQTVKTIEKLMAKPVKTQLEEDKIAQLMPLYSMLKHLDDSIADLMRSKTTMSDKEIQHWLYFEDSNFMDAGEAIRLNVANALR